MTSYPSAAVRTTGLTAAWSVADSTMTPATPRMVLTRASHWGGLRPLQVARQGLGYAAFPQTGPGRSRIGHVEPEARGESVSSLSTMDSAEAERLFVHWDAMVRASQRVLGSTEDAEDCAAEALLAALRNPESGNVVHIRSWLGAVAKRRAVDVLRAKTRDRRRLARLAMLHEPYVSDVAD